MAKSYVPKNPSRKAKKKYVGIAAIVMCLLLFTLLIGAAIGRYQRQLRSEGYVRAKEFYFTSDFLDGGTHTLNPGNDSVIFTLGNHADDLRFSEVDIAYTVTVEPGTGVQVKYDTQTLTKDAKSDGTVTISGLQPDTIYTVTATGTGGEGSASGYEKTLIATIRVLNPDPAVYKHLDTTNSSYVLLTVWAQGYTGDVTITPPAGANLIPDNTDPVMWRFQTGEEITDSTSFQDASGYSSHTYRFFYDGTPAGGVTAGNFTVTYNGGTAETKQPS